MRSAERYARLRRGSTARLATGLRGRRTLWAARITARRGAAFARDRSCARWAAPGSKPGGGALMRHHRFHYSARRPAVLAERSREMRLAPTTSEALLWQ